MAASSRAPSAESQPIATSAPRFPIEDYAAEAKRAYESGLSEEVLAEMVANVWRIVVAKGDNVGEGDTICILESMKMAIPVEATASGTIRDLNVIEGGVVLEGDVVDAIE